MGAGEVVSDAGDHDAGREEQTCLQAERALVVKEMLPPAPDHVLGDEDADQVSRALPTYVAEVSGEAPTDVAVGRVDDLQRHGNTSIAPFGGERVGL